MEYLIEVYFKYGCKSKDGYEQIVVSDKKYSKENNIRKFLEKYYKHIRDIKIINLGKYNQITNSVES